MNISSKELKKIAETSFRENTERLSEPMCSTS